jgi:hypothetical protein
MVSYRAMKKLTKKLILTAAKDSLTELVHQLQIDQTKKTKKLIDKIAIKFSSVLKSEAAKQSKKKLKASGAKIKTKKKKHVIPVQ